jgi:tetratricopeptide (TPR) repeat protein
VFVVGAQAEPPREVPHEFLRLRVAGKVAAYVEEMLATEILLRETDRLQAMQATDKSDGLQERIEKNFEELQGRIKLTKQLKQDILRLQAEQPATYQGLVFTPKWLGEHANEIVKALNAYHNASGDKSAEGSVLLSVVYGTTLSEAKIEMQKARLQRALVTEVVLGWHPGRAEISDEDLRNYCSRGIVAGPPVSVTEMAELQATEANSRRSSGGRVSPGGGAQYGGTGGRAVTSSDEQTDLLIELLEREKAKARTPKTSNEKQIAFAEEMLEELRKHREAESSSGSEVNEGKASVRQEDAATLFRRGASLMKEKRYDDAIRVLTSAIEASRDKGSPEAVRAKQLRALAYELKEEQQ